MTNKIIEEFESFDSFFSGLKAKDEKNAIKLYEKYIYSFLNKAIQSAKQEAVEEFYFKCEDIIFKEYKLALKNKDDMGANAFAMSLAIIKDILNKSINYLEGLK